LLLPTENSKKGRRRWVRRWVPNARIFTLNQTQFWKEAERSRCLAG
jgi:hypothetical protein